MTPDPRSPPPPRLRRAPAPRATPRARSRMSWRGDEAGAAASVAFLVAGTLFVAAIGALLLASRQGGSGAVASAVPEKVVGIQAGSLASVLLRSPGHTEAGTDWAHQAANATGRSPHAEEVTRLGLQEEGAAPLRMSFSKFQNLRLAPLAASKDGHVNYPEARRSLGLDALGLDFHVRAAPTLPDVATILREGHKDPHLRVLYLGDYERQAGQGRAPPLATGVSDQADRVVVYANVTHDGSLPTAFDALFELELKSSRVSFTLHTAVLQPGETGGVSFALLKTSDWEWKGRSRSVQVELHDPQGKLAEAEVSLAHATMTYPALRRNVFVEAERLSAPLEGGSGTARFHYQAVDGKGDPAAFGDWTLRILDASGRLLRTEALPDAAAGSISCTFTAAGSYAAQAWSDSLATAWNHDQVNVAATPLAGYAASPYFPQESAVVESRMLESLVGRFGAAAFSGAYAHPDLPHAPGGGVYPDAKEAMDHELPLALVGADGSPTLERYTTLVVGSNVDHNAMTSQVAKGTIRDWVLAGGTLIVLGSHDQSVSWLQPIFHSSIRSSSGGLTTPDLAHPLLTTSDVLDHTRFDNRGRAWSLGAQAGGAASLFTNAVLQGSDPVLAQSNPGSLGRGSVILTTWTPHDLHGPASPAEAGRADGLRLVNNLLMQSYRDLFLDYGPPIPGMASAVPAISRADILHPQFPEPILLTVGVYVFQEGGR